MKTQKLVSALLSESKEVKNSNGGCSTFRKVMDYVVKNASFFDADYNQVIRTKKQLSDMLESEFSNSDLQIVKNIYK